MSKILNRKQSKNNNEELAMSLPHKLDSKKTVEFVVNKAMRHSGEKIGLSSIKALIACIKKGDPIACSYYQYNVAKQLGEVMGLWDKNIKAVYAYGYDDNTSAGACSENISPSSLVHMIIWAERKTNALKALIEAIDRAMVQHHRNLLGVKELEHALDIQVIDDDDVKNHTGYAALLKSIYQSPVQVWGNNPGK
ncbi:MAG: hypothetical protein JXA01_04590 [Dehalococcoidia bacterium]|nr:hypothetical protein [Dehalococcoidia bacterium]